MVMGSILTANVHFERVTWSGSRDERPGAGTTVSFFGGEIVERESSIGTPRRIAGTVAVVREARFQDAVVAFRKRRFYDDNDDGRGCSRLIGADGAAIIVGRELSIVTKQL